MNDEIIIDETIKALIDLQQAMSRENKGTRVKKTCPVCKGSGEIPNKNFRQQAKRFVEARRDKRKDNCAPKQHVGCANCSTWTDKSGMVTSRTSIIQDALDEGKHEHVRPEYYYWFKGRYLAKEMPGRGYVWRRA